MRKLEKNNKIYLILDVEKYWFCKRSNEMSVVCCAVSYDMKLAAHSDTLSLRLRIFCHVGMCCNVLAHSIRNKLQLSNRCFFCKWILDLC